MTPTPNMPLRETPWRRCLSVFLAFLLAVLAATFVTIAVMALLSTSIPSLAAMGLPLAAALSLALFFPLTLFVAAKAAAIPALLIFGVLLYVRAHKMLDYALGGVLTGMLSPMAILLSGELPPPGIGQALAGAFFASAAIGGGAGGWMFYCCVLGWTDLIVPRSNPSI